MSLDSEARSQQLTLLAAHRRTLAHLLEQAAQFGGEVFAPPQTANGIAAARADIRQIKAALRATLAQVEDDPNDEAPPQVEPIQRAGGDVVMGDKVGGDKVGGDKVTGDKRTITTEGGDYAEGDIDKRQGGPFIEDSIVFGDVVGQKSIHYYQPVVTPLNRQQQRNRKTMLQKVKSIWIDGLLDQSLAKETCIVLGLTEQPDAVVLSLKKLVQELNRPARELPAGMLIIKVFEQMGGALLVLGAPGAGKTTLLLELARDLITRAEGDENFPIPVVFNLSSWAEKRRPLKDWLVEELNTKYDVPKKTAQTWVDTDALLPLLDGLDEVAVEHQSACVAAINSYRKEEKGLMPLAVCSRVADYEALTVKLRLQGAVLVQPLTQHEIDEYLEQAGEKLVGVRAALCDDTELAEMLDTPLMLSIVVLAYAGKSAAEVQHTGAPDERRRHLFDAYIAAMFGRRGAEVRYTAQQITGWLSWLADQMVAHNLTVYYIEHMQPDWLRPEQKRGYLLRVRLLTGLVAGLVAGLVVGPVVPLVAGLVVALVAGLIAGLMADDEQVNTTEVIRWSWSRNVLVLGLLPVLLNWPFFWLAIGFFERQIQKVVFGPIARLVTSLIFALIFALISALILGLSRSELPVKSTPNQGIRLSVRNCLSLGLSVGLIAVLGVGLGAGAPLTGVMMGLLFGLAFGLGYGGYDAFKHYTLRRMLARNGLLPFRDRELIPFLDYCAERIFLRKVGGGYIFVHRLLMEHFASLYTEQPAKPTAQKTVP